MHIAHIRAAKAALASILLASGVAALSAAQAAEPIQLRAELDRSILPSTPAARETTVVKISVDGLRVEQPEARPPVNLALVIDHSGYTHRIILLSDGQANVGPDTPQALGELGAKLVRERISVSTIGLGLGYDEDLMTRLASKSDGNTYFVRNAADLGGIFGTELGDVLNVVARNVKISARIPEDVRLVRCLGREGVIKGQRVESTINQIYGGQEKFVLVEVEAPAAQDKESREIAIVDITFEDALTQKKGVQNTTAHARFSADPAAVIQSANHKVQADYAEAVIAAANDEAIALTDANKHKEAAVHLRKTADSVRQLGEKYNNASVADIGQRNTVLSDQIAREGIDVEQRKQFKTMNAQKATQQGSSRDK